MKKNVILDTDVYNEIDDQFALAYLLKSQDVFQIDAVTIAPFTKKKYNTETSIEISYETARKIYEFLNVKDTSNIYRGATKYFTDDSNQENDAVNKIIEIALKNDKTYILSIGCITNLALAIKKEPKIIDKIEVIWLGSNFLFMKNNDFNFRQDVEAIRYVFESKVKLTVMPARPITSNLIISRYELEYRIKNKNALCDYFLSIFKYDHDEFEEDMRRPIWDISVIAYMINKSWFDTVDISCPIIKEDLSFELTQNRHNITFVQNLDSTKIYNDMFSKIV